MKKLLTVLCIASILVLSLPCALAAAPSISVGNNSLTVKYDNPNAQGGYTYVLLDAMERISLVEIDAGSTWTPDWTEEGLFKVLVYYKDSDGKTQSEASGFKEVRFSNKKDPLYWKDFLEDNNDPLPSIFTQPVEYNEPTPSPTFAPVTQSSSQSGALLYTLTPSQNYPTAAPIPTPTQTVSYPGTRPCFDHMNIRIRISDNDSHASTVGRSGPGTDMPQVATLNIGEVYSVLDCRIVEMGNVHWFMINKNGVYCWVASGRCERY